MAMRWYVLHVYSGFENKVAEAINEKAQKLKLVDRVGEIMVPTEEVVEVKRGQRVNAERKFFPGYVFVVDNYLTGGDIEQAGYAV